MGAKRPVSQAVKIGQVAHETGVSIDAIRFYEKHGFVVTGQDLNPRSGAPLHKMSWRP